MTEQYKICLDEECSQSRMASRENLEDFFTRLAWI